MVVWRADGSRVHVGEGHGGGADDKGPADLGELDAFAELVGRCHGAWGRCAGGDVSMRCGDRRDGTESKKEFRDGKVMLKTQRCFSLVDRVWMLGAAVRRGTALDFTVL